MRRTMTAAACLMALNLGCSSNTPGDTPSATPTSIQYSGPLRVFLTDDAYRPEGGVEGYDADCAADPANPGNSTFKALVGANTRSICKTDNCADGAYPVDWVLQPNTPYVRLDGQALFTTNDLGIFTDWPMEAALTDGGVNQASGLTEEWTLRDGLLCEDWTVYNDSPSAVGWTASADAGFLEGGQLDCGSLRLVCVEQP